MISAANLEKRIVTRTIGVHLFLRSTRNLSSNKCLKILIGL